MQRNRCKDAGCSNILVVAGDLASVKALGREQRVNKLPGRVMRWHEKLDSGNAHNCEHTQEQRIHWTFLFCSHLFCTLACYVLWCFYFWKRSEKKEKCRFNALQEIVNTQTKNSPQPPSHSPLILSCPNLGVVTPDSRLWGKDRERERKKAQALAENRPPCLPLKMIHSARRHQNGRRYSLCYISLLSHFLFATPSVISSSLFCLPLVFLLQSA